MINHYYIKKDDLIIIDTTQHESQNVIRQIYALVYEELKNCSF